MFGFYNYYALGAVDDLMHCRPSSWPATSGNSTSGRPQQLRVIGLTVAPAKGMKWLYTVAGNIAYKNQNKK